MRLTIDGTEIDAKEGETILEVARNEGIYIPALCYDPDLKPNGACRLCMVEIEGRNDLPLSCMTYASDGIVVHTNTEKVKEVRRRIVEVIRSDHEDNCKLCVKNEHCELQEICREVGVETTPYEGIKKLAYPTEVDESNPFFKLDRRRCVLCTKCVRICEEVQGVGALELSGYGFSTKVSGVGGKGIRDTACESCGQCLERCPTACLLPKIFVVPSQEVKTICPYCGVGCGMYMGVYYDRIVSVRGNRENPANRGNLCVKGRFGIADFVTSLSRLDSPLMRKNGELVSVSWEEALDIIASKLSEYRGDQFALIASGKLPNEDSYIAQKFARKVMGTNNIDHCARLCHSPSMVGLSEVLGSGATTNSISEIEEAKCIIAVGTNTTETHPVIGLRVRRACRKGAKVIVINPREINLCQNASLWLRNKPGSDVALLSGIARVMIDEGLLDYSFIEKRTEGFEAFKESLKEFDLHTAEQISGVSAADIVKAARIFAENSPACILYAMGITQHSHGTDNVRAIANLAMLTGNLGKPSSGIYALRGQNNVQGACDMGCLPNFYPGYQPVTDLEVREKFESAWGASLSAKPGLPLTEMFHAILEGKIKALYIVGENPMLSEPDITHVEEALRQLDLLIVQDIFSNETSRLAHVVLPAATFAEREGTFTNTERRIQLFRKGIEPIGSSQPDWWILCETAKRMGEEGFNFTLPSEIFDEMAKLTPIYGGVSHNRLEESGLQWPCPSQDHPGTPILYAQQFNRSNGKAKFSVLHYHPPKEVPDEEYPIVLITGRSLYHYHTGTMTRKVKGLNELKGSEGVEIHPEDANHLGIFDGEVALITSRRGRVAARVRVTESSPKGTVFMTFHFGEVPVNRLTNSALDPEAKIPALKICAVRLEKGNENNLQAAVGEQDLDDLY
jgi:formate dehydrogenase alpha subunit